MAKAQPRVLEAIRYEASRRVRRFPKLWKKGSSSIHDGFGLHQNPDGSWMFTEGVKRISLKYSAWLGIQETRNLNECLKRRGLVKV